MIVVTNGRVIYSCDKGCGYSAFEDGFTDVETLRAAIERVTTDGDHKCYVAGEEE